MHSEGRGWIGTVASSEPRLKGAAALTDTVTEEQADAEARAHEVLRDNWKISVN